MSWGTELWDQYEKLLNNADQGHDFVKRVDNFVKERIEIESEYAKKLRKLCRNFKTKDRDSKLLTVKAFNVVVDETDSLAAQRELVAENMQTRVKDQLRQLGKELVIERKKAANEGSKQLTGLANSLEALERSKKSYERACRDAEGAQVLYEKADADLSLSRAQVEKTNQVFRQKKSAEDEAKGNYSVQLHQTNKCQNDHYHQHMPAVLTMLQHAEEKRIMKLADHLAAYSDSEHQVQGNVSVCLENMTTATRAIDYQIDVKAVIDELKTGYKPPEDIQFETYKSGAKAKKIKKAPPKAKKEEKEDFSHLPPAKRKKKLLEKVREFDEKVTKEMQEKNAMEKMMEVYKKNPALGDPGIVSQELVERSRILDHLNTEKYKFETWLAALENKDAPPPPRKISTDPPVGGGASPAPARSSQHSQHSQHSQPQPQPQPTTTTETVESENEFKSDNDDDNEFVEVEENIPIGRCRALYDFPGTNPGELEMKASEVLDLLVNNEDGWIRVRRGDSEGYVPLSYVEMLC